MLANNCSNCSNAIFDAQWGEYKCSIHKIVVPESPFDVECSAHIPGTPQESKKNADYEATLGES